MKILIIVFVINLSLLIYTYFGYPLLMIIIARFKRQKQVMKGNIEPFVSLVIPAYNEEKDIGAKLSEILTLDYPKEKIEVVVVSDASTDKTDEIVKEFAGRKIQLFRLEQRSGKIAAYQRVLPYLRGEIIVFSDATSHLHKDCLKYLTADFNDPSVGCVGGLLKYINPKNVVVGEGESKYWKYEKKIKEYESKLSSLTSVSGTLYAVRKELYPQNIKDDLADDLIVPLEVKKRGFQVILEERAICEEIVTLSIKAEMAKRVRITIQNIRGLMHQAEMLNPFRYGVYSVLLFSHKMLRLLVPLVLLLLLTSNIILSVTSDKYLFFLIGQIIFYLMGFAGYYGSKKIGFRLVDTIFYFCLSNLAILVGIIEFLKGKKMATWEPVRANS